MSIKAYTFEITGIVQGVGFRPFVYKLALQCNITGFVRNDTKGVFIHAQGTREALECFQKGLLNPPEAAKIAQILCKEASLLSVQEFSIQKSKSDSTISAVIPADIALCGACLKELRDPKNRRFNYAFISCTNCGGRYSLMRALPYDRENTAMADFKMCSACKEEYENPNSRRFHSEINCCEDCGPKLFFVESQTFAKTIADLKATSAKESLLCDSLLNASFVSLLDNPLKRATQALKEGKILAIKGVGGYALVCNALNQKSVQALRSRKRRARKPFALMCKDVAMAEIYAHISQQEKEFLESSIAPIVLLRKRDMKQLDGIAPNLESLGIILPYAPLHFLLFDGINFPLIFTSANLSGEPILKDFSEIVEKLNDVCDGVLLYNRAILNPVDDSLVRFLQELGQMQVLRRARGFLNDVDLSIVTKSDFIALGAQQKATFCLKFQNKTLLSPHLGDLENIASMENFTKTQALFSTQFGVESQNFVLDLHPHYTQRRCAKGTIYTLQHHFAHLLSNVAENRLLESEEKVLGVVFDGTGYGEDGKIWGGEFLEWNPKAPLEYQRIASFEDFVLLGGERAVRESRRVGLALLFATFKDNYSQLNLPFLRGFSKESLQDFYAMFLKQRVLCSSVGRLFDGISALCLACGSLDYEGEGGMVLEALATQALEDVESYPFSLVNGKISYCAMVDCICKELSTNKSASVIALRFHYTLAKIIAEVAKPYKHIALSGGCFQNALLIRLVLESLADKKVFFNSVFPCNDGGISIGQAYYMYLLEHFST